MANQQGVRLLDVGLEETQQAIDVALDHVRVGQDLGTLVPGGGSKLGPERIQAGLFLLELGEQGLGEASHRQGACDVLHAVGRALDLLLQLSDLGAVHLVQIVEVPGERVDEPPGQVWEGQLFPQRMDDGGGDLLL